MSEKQSVEIAELTEPTDTDLAEMGLTRDEYNKQVSEQMKDISHVLNGFFDIREALKKSPPTDEEINQLLEIFGNIKYYGVLFDQFRAGEVLFSIENGKMQVVQNVPSTVNEIIPKNRTLN